LTFTYITFLKDSCTDTKQTQRSSELEHTTVCPTFVITYVMAAAVWEWTKCLMYIMKCVLNHNQTRMSCLHLGSFESWIWYISTCSAQTC